MRRKPNTPWRNGDPALFFQHERALNLVWLMPVRCENNQPAARPRMQRLQIPVFSAVFGSRHTLHRRAAARHLGQSLVRRASLKSVLFVFFCPFYRGRTYWPAINPGKIR